MDAQPVEPEQGHLVQHAAFVGDAGGEDVIEGGDAVGGDDQQVIADSVDVADLAAADPFQAGQISIEKDSGHGNNCSTALVQIRAVTSMLLEFQHLRDGPRLALETAEENL